ncbi:MAG: (Fe-S)-binding protein [Chloroflexi bacterium]|jgi:Fe-S oxidoreductase|nr:(Fe-S)-binding protein [Chloroflexota bacterium]MBT7081434.1 (Fe-S)-binding protein [Chloroflexota bacterium]
MNPIDAGGLSAIGYILFWGLFAVAVAVASYRLRQLIQYLSVGKRDAKLTDIVKRIASALFHVVGQWCGFKNVSRKDRAAIGHVLIVWGFFLFVLYYFLFIVIGAGFGIYNAMQNNTFFLVYSWFMNIFAVLIITGIIWGIIRRFVIKPARLKGEPILDPLIALVLIGTIPLIHLFKEAAAIAASHAPAGLGGATPPVAQLLSNIFNNPAAADAAYPYFFWAHWLIVLFIVVQFGWSSHLHMLMAPINLLLRSREPKGALKPIDIENTETFGVNKITDFTMKQLIDGFACISCGRCQDACPAFASEKPLNPKELIQDLNKHLRKVAPGIIKGEEDSAELIDNVIRQETIWSCTTCRSCMEVCPVANEHMPKIMEFRRNLVLEQGQMPETIMGALRSVEQRGHPWRGTLATRTDWTEGLDIKQASDGDFDVLFWVGCTNALDDRCRNIAIDTANLMKNAGVNFAILGEEESCCGDVARRSGNEYLFQMQAMRNIETLKKYDVKKIVTSCPHCLNALKYEYPQFEGQFEVIHHTELIADLIADGKLSATAKGKSITYHDPCYLGRYSDIYEEPRQILKSVASDEYTEIDRHRTKRSSFCCGGGGGRCWMEEEVKISHLRIDDAIKSGADILAVACPLCMIMFEDAAKAKGVEGTLKVMDIAEVVAESTNQ